MPRMARYWMLVGFLARMSFCHVPPTTVFSSRSSAGMTSDAVRTFDCRSTRSAWARESRCVFTRSL